MSMQFPDPPNLSSSSPNLESSPALYSNHKMTSAQQRKASHDSAVDGLRKRVGKACDRCRLKKSKCDGEAFCSRCKADNAVCVFGERKKLHDKVYPKGYVEMLEQQQGQLVAGLQEMYKRLLNAQAWDGPVLSEATGQPLTHDLLAALDLLEMKHDDSGELEMFEDDFQTLQSKLIANGAGFSQRRGSFSSDSDHSQHGHDRSQLQGTPSISSSAAVYDDNFNNFNLASIESPVPQRRRVQQQQQQQQPRSSTKITPQLQQLSTLGADPRFYEPEWAMDASRFNLSPTELDPNLDDVSNGMDGSGIWDDDATFGLGLSDMSTAFSAQLTTTSTGASNLDAMDMEFNQFIQVMT